MRMVFELGQRGKRGWLLMNDTSTIYESYLAVSPICRGQKQGPASVRFGRRLSRICAISMVSDGIPRSILLGRETQKTLVGTFEVVKNI